MDAPSSAAAALQARLVAALCRPGVLGADVTHVDAVETHISHVLLAGRYAYKIKKPVATGFLDFTTLAARQRFCDEELRLNRRLAPQVYLDVVPICGTADAPVVGGAGTPIEYAVRMREFAQDALGSRVLARGAFTPAHVDALAARIASFHGEIAVARADGPFGTPDDIRAWALEDFDAIAPLQDDAGDRARLAALRAWTVRECARRAATFDARREGGFVRECHGDLHLGNIALVDGALVIFDGIEFNARLRWIDVMSEAAFTAMDLEDRGRPDLAHRFVDAYLRHTGDYAGLAVLPFYVVYRAMVRAKVTWLRASQLPAGAARDAACAEGRGYLRIAERHARPPRPALVITHGLSGCGKTTLTQPLLERLPAIRIVNDVERKRLFALPAHARTGSPVDAGIYSPEATEATYERALDLARTVVGAGAVAIVDATFLRRRHRDRFRGLAAQLGIPFAVVDFRVTEATLRQRVRRREDEDGVVSEAGLAVLERQLVADEPLAADELPAAFVVDAEAPLAAGDAARWQPLVDRLGAGTAPG